MATDQALPYRSKKKWLFDFGQNLERIQYGMNIAVYSDRSTAFGETLDGFTIVNAYSNIQLMEALSLRFVLNNLFNEDYQLNENYRQDGTNGSMRLVYNF